LPALGNQIVRSFRGKKKFPIPLKAEKNFHKRICRLPFTKASEEQYKEKLEIVVSMRLASLFCVTEQPYPRVYPHFIRAYPLLYYKYKNTE